jgi:hypothetical protein
MYCDELRRLLSQDINRCNSSAQARRSVSTHFGSASFEIRPAPSVRTRPGLSEVALYIRM